MAVHGSILEGNPLSKYHEVQFKLVKSIYNYRHSQVSPDKRVYFLRNAFNYANEAECLARDCQFKEMAEWSKTNKALCTEELVRIHAPFNTNGGGTLELVSTEREGDTYQGTVASHI
jgi:hypothetical protein